RIALTQGGKLLKINSPQGIIAEYDEKIFAVSSEDMHRLLKDLREKSGVKTAFSFGETIHVTVTESTTESEIREYLLCKGHGMVRVEKIEASIEDCFMALMK
ncbi:MAG: ABC transporter ATP-binding protein, partial [Muribaculaceae bacterium]